MMTNATDPSTAAGLSEYELQRIGNIKRNNARLLALGLISKQEEAESNAIAEGKQPSTSATKATTHGSTQNQEDQGTAGNNRKKRASTKDAPTSSEPERKSRRLQGKAPEHKPSESGEGQQDHSPTHDADIAPESRAERVQACREQRQRLALHYSKQTDAEKRAARENPTATYEHCLHRVKTMNEKGLLNRVKAIERASGKHCVVKMAIFKSCLQDEGLWELAGVAEAALERLKALQPPPTVEEG